jgi:hypothetical protein
MSFQISTFVDEKTLMDLLDFIAGERRKDKDHLAFLEEFRYERSGVGYLERSVSVKLVIDGDKLLIPTSEEEDPTLNKIEPREKREVAEARLKREREWVDRRRKNLERIKKILRIF